MIGGEKVKQGLTPLIGSLLGAQHYSNAKQSQTALATVLSTSSDTLAPPPTSKGKKKTDINLSMSSLFVQLKHAGSIRWQSLHANSDSVSPYE